jgi:uncharacterized protein (TIGR00369 family)
LYDLTERSVGQTHLDPATFIRSTQQGLAGFLGIEIVSATKDSVVGQFVAGPQHFTAGERVHGGAIMAFADTLGAYGAVLNLPAGFTTSTIESKTNFFRAGRPGQLVGESVPLHFGRTTMVWQTSVRGEDEERVAQVTQTQIVLRVDKTDLNNEARSVAPNLRPNEAPTAADEPANGVTASRRKEQIFRAACDVMARKGFARATMREIASTAGMPVPTMYQYLRSKDDLLTMLFDTYLAEVERNISIAAAQGRTATQKLAAAIRANLASFDSYHKQIRLMNRETQALNSEARERVKRHMTSYIQLFSRIIAEGIQKNEFRNVDPDLVGNFIAMLCEVWPLRFWSVGRFGLAAVQDAILAFVADGLRKPIGEMS